MGKRVPQRYLQKLCNSVLCFTLIIYILLRLLHKTVCGGAPLSSLWRQEVLHGKACALAMSWNEICVNGLKLLIKAHNKNDARSLSRLPACLPVDVCELGCSGGLVDPSGWVGATGAPPKLAKLGCSNAFAWGAGWPNGAVACDDTTGAPKIFAWVAEGAGAEEANTSASRSDEAVSTIRDGAVVDHVRFMMQQT